MNLTPEQVSRLSFETSAFGGGSSAASPVESQRRDQTVTKCIDAPVLNAAAEALKTAVAQGLGCERDTLPGGGTLTTSIRVAELPVDAITNTPPSVKLPPAPAPVTLVTQTTPGRTSGPHATGAVSFYEQQGEQR